MKQNNIQKYIWVFELRATHHAEIGLTEVSVLIVPDEIFSVSELSFTPQGAVMLSSLFTIC